MKKSLCLAVLLVVAVMFVSCARSRLSAAVEKANSECPVSLGMAGEMTEIRMEGDDVIFTYNVNESLTDVSVIESNKELFKENTMEMLGNPTGDVRSLFEELSGADAGMVIEFVGRDSGKSAKIRLSSKDVKLLLDDEADKNPVAMLKTQVDLTNLQYPMEIETGMTITHMTLEDDCVVYNVECDESLYSIEQIRRNITAAKNGIKQALSAGDPAINMFIGICKDAHKNIAYRYVGDRSGESCLIEVACDEL